MLQVSMPTYSINMWAHSHGMSWSTSFVFRWTCWSLCESQEQARKRQRKRWPRYPIRSLRWLLLQGRDASFPQPASVNYMHWGCKVENLVRWAMYLWAIQVCCAYSCSKEEGSLYIVVCFGQLPKHLAHTHPGCRGDSTKREVVCIRVSLQCSHSLGSNIKNKTKQNKKQSRVVRQVRNKIDGGRRMKWRMDSTHSGRPYTLTWVLPFVERS